MSSIETPDGRSANVARAVNEGNNAEQTGNIFSEFATSAWRAGVQKPIESLAQLAGAHVTSTEDNRQLTGAMRIANMAGNAAGTIFDMVALSKVTALGMARVLPGGGAGAALAEGTMARTLVQHGTTGALYGGLLTPLHEGESNWRRIGNATVDAGTFMTLGAGSAAMAPVVGNRVLGRLANNLTSGLGAGMVNANLEAWTHGHTASLAQTAEAGVTWAIGNAVLGEGMHQAGRGFNGLFGNRAPEAALVMTTAAAAAEAAAEARVTSFARRLEQPAAVERAEAAPTVQPAEARAEARTEARAEGEQRVEQAERPRIGPIVASESVSMKRLALSDRPEDQAMLDRLLEQYMPKLQEAFPLPGEIETAETYRGYLRDAQFPWDMIVLRDGNQNVLGGIQYQILEPNGQVIKKAAWGEHIWLTPEARNFQNFRTLLRVAEQQISERGGDMVFMEFNNPEKMTPAQQREDASAGLAPEDREKIWGRVGIHVAVDPVGRLAEYAQPSMDGQPPVDFLSIGFVGLRPITGMNVPKSDYLRLLHQAHRTIDGVEIPEGFDQPNFRAAAGTPVDETVAMYTQSVHEAPGNGFTLVPLNALGRAREAALEAARASMQESIAQAIARGTQMPSVIQSEVNDMVTQMVAERGGQVSATEMENLRLAAGRMLENTIQRAFRQQGR